MGGRGWNRRPAGLHEFPGQAPETRKWLWRSRGSGQIAPRPHSPPPPAHSATFGAFFILLWAGLFHWHSASRFSPAAFLLSQVEPSPPEWNHLIPLREPLDFVPRRPVAKSSRDRLCTWDAQGAAAPASLSHHLSPSNNHWVPPEGYPNLRCAGIRVIPDVCLPPQAPEPP